MNRRKKGKPKKPARASASKVEPESVDPATRPVRIVLRKSTFGSVADLKRALELKETSPRKFARSRRLQAIVREWEAVAKQTAADFGRLFDNLPKEERDFMSRVLPGSRLSEITLPQLREGYRFRKPRGERKSRETQEKIQRAARLRTKGWSLHKMAPDLFPQERDLNVAYHRTRTFYSQNREEIERLAESIKPVI